MPADHAQDPARAAAEAIRDLNHATIFGGGYEWPSDVDAMIAALHELAARLPQALGQASQWLAAAHEAGDVGHDLGDHLADADVDEIEQLLRDAESAARRLAEILDAAHQLTAHLRGVIHDEDDETGGGEPL
jgi:hypothetical protein